MYCVAHIPIQYTHTRNGKDLPISRWRMSGERDYTVIVIDVRYNCFCCVQLCMWLLSSCSALQHTHTHTHSPSRFCSLLFHCFYLISSSTISPSHQFHQVSAENYSFCTRSLSPLIRAALIRLGNWLKFQPMILQIINTNIYQLVSHLTVYIRSIFSSHFRHILPN